MLRKTVTVRFARVLFLNVRRVGEHQRAQLFRRWCAENATSEPAGDKAWQVTAVIEMRVREDDRVDRCRIDRQRLPVPDPQLLQPLEQPAVDEHAPAAELEQVFRSRHGSRRTEESQRQSDIQRQSETLACASVQDYRVRD